MQTHQKYIKLYPGRLIWSDSIYFITNFLTTDVIRVLSHAASALYWTKYNLIFIPLFKKSPNKYNVRISSLFLSFCASVGLNP